MVQYNLNVFAGGNRAKEKYNKNKVHQILINNFMKNVLELLENVSNKNIFEIGCGEGQIMGVLHQNGYEVSGMDYSAEAVEITKNNFQSIGVCVEVYEGNVYNPECIKKNCTLLCCEVLEHLEKPEKALQIISEMANEYILLSVPCEPLWCILNFIRGKYWGNWGNTPGHINHWNKKKFVKMCSEYGEVIAVRSPLPWTMVLLRKK